MKGKKSLPSSLMKNIVKINAGLLVLLLVVVLFNSAQLGQLNNGAIVTGQITGTSTGGSSPSGMNIIPTGIPAIYGKELGISFDDVSSATPQLADATIGVLAQIDRETTLEGEDLSRYINVLYTTENGISCEYCCGARSVIFEDGEAACGCAHSYAMRGLAKYLITEHGDEFTDLELLEEIGKWKTLFFPGQIAQKAQILDSQGVELNYINLASNKYRGIEKGSGGGSMVGGC